MSENQAPPYSLRMPSELREKLEARAKKSGRSLNSEIVKILEDGINNNGATNSVLPTKEEYEQLIEAIEDNKRLAQEMLNKAQQPKPIQPSELFENAEIKIIQLDETIKRVIHGKLLNAFDLDFTKDLSSLKTDIEMTLDILKNSKLSLKFAFMTKNIIVYQGHNHLDIVDNGVGSLNWLIVEDHLV